MRMSARRTSVIILLIFLFQIVATAADSAIGKRGDETQEVVINGCSVFVGLPDISSNFRSCMDNGLGEYQCIDDPVRARRQFDEGRVPGLDEHYNMGVVQRVDGTEAEQEAIQDIIARMIDYFYGEVMTRPVYEGIRDKW